jgi:error-prone DNA polymerase
MYEKFRRVVIGARMVMVEGLLQKEQGVVHVIARRLVDLTPELMEVMTAPTLPSTQATHQRVTPPSPWRHPRDVRVLPKGRNFH